MRIRTSLLSAIALCLISSLALAQDATKKVTFAHTALPTDALLEKLSHQFGIKLDCTPLMASNVVLVRLQDASLADTLKAIATATSGEWLKTDSGYRLTKSVSAFQADERSEIQEKEEILRERIAERQKNLDKYPKLDHAAAREMQKEQSSGNQRIMRIANDGGDDGGDVQVVMGGFMAGPADRALTRILQKLNLKDLASMPEGSRLVYATSPTQMQRPLPGSAFDALRTFVDENAAWNAAYKEGLSNAEVPIVTFGSEPVSRGGTPTSALIVFTAPEFGRSLMAHLQVFNERGQTMATGLAMLELDPRMRKRSEKPIEQSPDTSAEKAIKLSTESREFLDILKQRREPQSAGAAQAEYSFSIAFDMGFGPITIGSGLGAKELKVTPAWRERALHPESFEFLGLCASDGLLAAAEHLQTNMVACLPDSLIEASASAFFGAELKPSEFWRQALSDWELKATKEGSWTILRPKYAHTARASRVDRAALGKLLRQVSANGLATLDELAEYTFKTNSNTGSDQNAGLIAQLVNAPFAATTFQSTFPTQRDMLKFWGSTNASQRQLLRSGKPVALSTLSPSQKELVSHIVFWSFDGPMVSREGDGREQFAQMPMPNPDMGLMSERTVVLPNGLLPQGSITLTVNAQEGVLARKEGSTLASPLTLGNLALTRIKSGVSGDLQKVMASQPEYDRFKLGQQLDMQFRFQLSPNAFMGRTLSDFVFERQIAAVPFDQLPQSVRDRVAKLGERLKASLGNMRFAMPQVRGQQKPPAP